MKIILKLPTRTPSIDLYREIKVLKVSDIRNYQQLIYLYKLINNLASNTFGEYLIPKTKTVHRLTRSTDEFYLPAFRLTTSQLSYLYQTANLWNTLPVTVKTKKNITIIHIIVETTTATSLSSRPVINHNLFFVLHILSSPFHRAIASN